MKPIRKLLLVLASFVVLGFVAVLVNSNPAGAQNRGGAPVVIENTASEPALVRDVDNARAPFQSTCSPSFPDSGTIQ